MKMPKMKMPRFKLCFVIALISFAIAPYLSNLLPGGGEEAQLWLDREIAYIEHRMKTCEDDYIRSAMEYTVKHYRRVGPFGVRVMQLPDGTHGYNMPTCPGITVDEEVPHLGLQYGAFVLVHESMHNWAFPPSYIPTLPLTLPHRRRRHIGGTMIPRINFFGGPGVGKSTLAAKLYSHMKRNGANVELVQEEVKQWAYEGRQIHPWDCVPIFGRQFEREQRLLQNGVHQIITDSPLLLNVFYSQTVHGCPAQYELANICKKFDKAWPPINFLIYRPDQDFDTSGRYQTEATAILIDQMVEDQLAVHGVKYHYIRPDSDLDFQACLNLLETT